MAKEKKFVKIEDTIYPVDIIQSVSIINTGGTPAKYGLSVTMRPIQINVDYNTGKSCGSNSYALTGAGNGWANGSGKYDTYEDAAKALKAVLNDINY